VDMLERFYAPFLERPELARPEPVRNAA